jgi:hypothetical protein
MNWHPYLMLKRTCTEQDVLNLEENIGTKLPEDFRQCLLRNSGRVPSHSAMAAQLCTVRLHFLSSCLILATTHVRRNSFRPCHWTDVSLFLSFRLLQMIMIRGLRKVFNHLLAPPQTCLCSTFILLQLWVLYIIVWMIVSQNMINSTYFDIHTTRTSVPESSWSDI